MSKSPSRILRIVLPIAFLALGMGGMITLIKNRPVSEQGEAKEIAIPVSTIKAELNDVQVKIPVAGKTMPDKQVILQPQVAGEVVWVSDKLQKGAAFQKDEPLIKIDPTDYELAVEQAKAAVKQAEVSLAVEKSRGKVAKKEWDIMGTQGRKRSSLALRQPQLELAKSNVLAAKASLKSAKLRLKRTTINAPFNGIVVAEKVDMGQVVGPGAQLITFISADRAILEAQVKLSDLNWIALPEANEPGSKVVLNRKGNAEVIGVGGRLDDTARTATLLIGVENDNTDLANRLYANTWIGGEVHGHEIKDVMMIPRYAVSDKKTVWVASSENVLTKKSIVEVWADAENLYAAKEGSDLMPGDMIIVSALTTPVEGMLVNNVSMGDTAR